MRQIAGEIMWIVWRDEKMREVENGKNRRSEFSYFFRVSKLTSIQADPFHGMSGTVVAVISLEWTSSDNNPFEVPGLENRMEKCFHSWPRKPDFFSRKAEETVILRFHFESNLLSSEEVKKNSFLRLKCTHSFLKACTQPHIRGLWGGVSEGWCYWYN